MKKQWQLSREGVVVLAPGWWQWQWTSRSGSVLKAGPAGLTYGSDVSCRTERGTKGHSQVWGLDGWKDGAPVS